MVNKKINKLIVAKALPVLNTHIFSKVFPFNITVSFYRGYSSNHSNSSNNNNSNNINNNGSHVESFIDYFLSGIICLLFLLVIYYMFESYITFIITFYISFLVSLYLSDNFKYSNLYIIRLNQKFAINIITIIVSIIVVFYIMDYFDIINHILCEENDSVDISSSNSDISNNSSNKSSNKSSSDYPLPSQPPLALAKDGEALEAGIKDNYVKKEDVIVTSKEVLDKVGDVVTNIVKDAVGPFIENITTAAGAGSAGGVIGGKIISSMPAGSSITHKVFAGAGAAALTAAGVAGAIKTVNTAFTNKSTKDSISSNINISEERSPSPLETFIHSVLEPYDITSPLETLLDCQIFFIALSLLCILCIIMILGIWLFNKYNINIIKYIIGTRLGNKLMGKIVNIKFIKNMNNKFFISMIVIYTILLIFCLIFQIFIGVELRLKLDDYIEVHKHMKNPNHLFGFEPK